MATIVEVKKKVHLEMARIKREAGGDKKMTPNKWGRWEGLDWVLQQMK